MTTPDLAPCPDRPNCVSTDATRDDQRMEPIPFGDSAEQAQSRVRAALGGEKRTTIVAEAPGRICAEVRSGFFRFVDDVDVIVDADARLIRFRSASRLGAYDFGVNRKRMERFSARVRRDAR